VRPEGQEPLSRSARFVIEKAAVAAKATSPPLQQRIAVNRIDDVPLERWFHYSKMPTTNGLIMIL
jgi:hypothetical protein